MRLWPALLLFLCAALAAPVDRRNSESQHRRKAQHHSKARKAELLPQQGQEQGDQYEDDGQQQEESSQQGGGEGVVSNSDGSPAGSAADSSPQGSVSGGGGGSAPQGSNGDSSSPVTGSGISGDIGGGGEGTPSNGADAMNMSAGCTPPDPRGYLVYLAFDQQFNNQVLTVAENLLLAKKLGRILVLTGFMLQADTGKKTSDGVDYFSGTKVLKPFADVFEPYASLGASGYTENDWITLESFKKICPGLTVEAHDYVPKGAAAFEGQGTISATYSQWHLPEMLYPFDGPRSNTLSGMENVVFSTAKVYCHDYGQRVPLSELYKPQVLVTEGLLFKTGGNEHPATEPDFAAFSEPHTAVSGFKWANDVDVRANRFVRKHFGETPFISMHWRRGYLGPIQGRNQEQVLVELRAATAQATEGSEGNPPDVYLASNQFTYQDAKALERDLGTGQRVISMQLDGNSTIGLDVNQLSFVEMAICSKAKVFVPTSGSTWSMNVKNLRVGNGLLECGGTDWTCDPRFLRGGKKSLREQTPQAAQAPEVVGIPGAGDLAGEQPMGFYQQLPEIDRNIRMQSAVRTDS